MCEQPRHELEDTTPSKGFREKSQQRIVDHWNADSDSYFQKTDYDALFAALASDPYAGFPRAVASVINAYCPDLKGKNVCVPSCGDNVAVFALCALGANVTATDISNRQIDNARTIAAERGLDIQYHCMDSMKLDALPGEAFDLVYTSNGVHVWIHDLEAMYRGIYRVLKPGGHYIMFDTHPFCRPFDSELHDGNFRAVKPYSDVGPFENDPTFGWRIQDFVNALIACGLTIHRMEEFHSAVDDFPAHNYLHEKDDVQRGKYDWRKNPWAALPQCLALCCQKT